jgi:hypothetical protein
VPNLHNYLFLHHCMWRRIWSTKNPLSWVQKKVAIYDVMMFPTKDTNNHQPFIIYRVFPYKKTPMMLSSQHRCNHFLTQ